MKINRYRKVHKVLKFYTNNFGFRKPYQVLIDGTICVAALKNQVNIHEQFPKYLDGSVKLLTTQCIIQEVEKLGPATFGALLIVKKFGLHKCGHGNSPKLASECILDMIEDKNNSRYIIATQDRDLQEKCRRIQAVPLLYLHAKSPTLETPSNFSQNVAKEKSFNDFQVNDYERKKLTALKGNEEVEEILKKNKKRKGGPNPLSCKKKKRKMEETVKPKSLDPNKKKRKRKRNRNRNRLVKKIKSEIMASIAS